jgi:hypothetical protein
MLAPSHAEFYSVENCPWLMEVEEFEVPKLSSMEGERELSITDYLTPEISPMLPLSLRTHFRLRYHNHLRW